LLAFSLKTCLQAGHLILTLSSIGGALLDR
jgi:hypothetical protein